MNFTEIDGVQYLVIDAEVQIPPDVDDPSSTMLSYQPFPESTARTDIVDEIDTLVDASLSRPIVDDYSRNRYDKCWHCGRQWHGIPLTRRIAEMYQHGEFDESYRVDTDDTEILCCGSDFIGPMKAPGVGAQRTSFTHATRDERTVSIPMHGPDDTINLIVWGRHPPTQQRWWRTTLPAEAHIELRRDPRRDPTTDTVTIEIGDTSQTFDAEHVRFHYETDEVMLHQFRADVPVRVMETGRNIVDVLAESAPSIGGTWAPLTAPGVIGHPDASLLQRICVADGWVYVGAIRDDGPMVLPDAENLVADWLGPILDEPPRTRAEILEQRRRTNAAREQRLGILRTQRRARDDDAPAAL